MKRWTVGAVFVLVVACEGNKAPTPDSLAAAAATTADSAQIAIVRIIEPADGDSTGADVTVVLSTEGVTIEPASGMRVARIGHHHLFLDTLPTADGVVIPPTTSRVVHIGTGDSTFTFKGLTPGPHEIIAVIGFGDHAAMPGRRDTVRFFVRR